MLHIFVLGLNGLCISTAADWYYPNIITIKEFV